MTRDEIIANKNNLYGANLQRANLYGADLYGANLQRANLYGADLYGANLHGAYLQRANLYGANLHGANLKDANLKDANLQRAYLQGANLYGAYLHGANLYGADLPHFQIPDGTLTVWGKKNGVIVKLVIPSGARRTACLINRKCRAEYAIVVDVENETKETIVTNEWSTTVYKINRTVKAHAYDDNPSIDCAPGIHFWLTREEAEEW